MVQRFLCVAVAPRRRVDRGQHLQVPRIVLQLGLDRCGSPLRRCQREGAASGLALREQQAAPGIRGSRLSRHCAFEQRNRQLRLLLFEQRTSQLCHRLRAIRTQRQCGAIALFRRRQIVRAHRGLPLTHDEGEARRIQRGRERLVVRYELCGLLQKADCAEEIPLLHADIPHTRKRPRVAGLLRQNRREPFLRLVDAFRVQRLVCRHFRRARRRRRCAGGRRPRRGLAGCRRIRPRMGRLQFGHASDVGVVRVDPAQPLQVRLCQRRVAVQRDRARQPAQGFSIVRVRQQDLVPGLHRQVPAAVCLQRAGLVQQRPRHRLGSLSRGRPGLRLRASRKCGKRHCYEKNPGGPEPSFTQLLDHRDRNQVSYHG